MSKKRKPIQISVSNSINDDGVIIFIMTAICDDGSIWTQDYHSKNARDSHWSRIDDIPQDKD